MDYKMFEKIISIFTFIALMFIIVLLLELIVEQRNSNISVEKVVNTADFIKDYCLE